MFLSLIEISIIAFYGLFNNMSWKNVWKRKIYIIKQIYYLLIDT
jgi:hypothetical protein